MSVQRASIAVAAAMVVMFAAGHAAHASGYHPPFDRAVTQADWIVLHEVVSDHAPKDKLVGIPKALGIHVGRIFLVRVKRSFKGPYKKGDLLYVWDTADMSSASYSITKGRDNLTFLLQPKTRPYLAGVDTRDASKHVAVPIRNLNGSFGRGRALAMDAWLRLLDLTRVGKRKIAVSELRSIVATSKSPVLLRYALTHWPSPLAPRDAKAIKALLARTQSAAGVSAAALDLLRKNKVSLSAKALRSQLRVGPHHARAQMLRQITARNVGTVRDLLWVWATRDEPSAADGLLLLARLQRSYLVTKLRNRRLPFWLEIPALHALRTKLGRPYSSHALKIDQWQLSQAASLVKGKTFSATYSLTTRRPVWRHLVKLIVPLLPTMKPEAREITVGIARTWGYRVRRRGKRIQLGKRERVPLTITLERVAGSRHKFKITERARRTITLCPKSDKRTAIAQGRNSITSMDSTHGDWHDSATKRTCFKRVSGLVHTEIVDLADLLKNVKKPGMYEVSVDLLHTQSGSQYGLNAWTGMVYSNRLRVQLP